MEGSRMKILQATGAYGRIYITWKAVVADWEGGRDFQIIDAPYSSIRDVEVLNSAGYTHIEFIDPIHGTLLLIRI